LHLPGSIHDQQARGHTVDDLRAQALRGFSAFCCGAFLCTQLLIASWSAAASSGDWPGYPKQVPVVASGGRKPEDRKRDGPDDNRHQGGQTEERQCLRVHP
jgi:hypothetical protein